MTTSEKTLLELVQELPPTLHAEVRDFVEFLIAKQQRNQERSVENDDWPEGFFEQTAGSITDPTFVRPPQGAPEARLPLE
jgi:hypothetical protein